MTSPTDANFHAVNAILTDHYGFGGLVTNWVQTILQKNLPPKEKTNAVADLLAQAHGRTFGTKSIARRIVTITQ
jgi:hypothetical protein